MSASSERERAAEWGLPTYADHLHDKHEKRGVALLRW